MYTSLPYDIFDELHRHTIYHNFRGGILGWKIYTRESSREANPFGWK